MDIMYAAVDSRKVKLLTHKLTSQCFTLLFRFGKIKRKNGRTLLMLWV